MSECIRVSKTHLDLNCSMRQKNFEQYLSLFFNVCDNKIINSKHSFHLQLICLEKPVIEQKEQQYMPRINEGANLAVINR
jgi:hypothetical protein